MVTNANVAFDNKTMTAGINEQHECQRVMHGKIWSHGRRDPSKMDQKDLNPTWELNNSALDKRYFFAHCNSDQNEILCNLDNSTCDTNCRLVLITNPRTCQYNSKIHELVIHKTLNI